MRKFKFWTKTEDRLLKSTFHKSNSVEEATKELSKKIDRTSTSIKFRMYKIFGKKRVPKVSSKAIVLPEGFSFDLKPNRVVLYKNKVEIYF